MWNIWVGKLFTARLREKKRPTIFSVRLNLFSEGMIREFTRQSSNYQRVDVNVRNEDINSIVRPTFQCFFTSFFYVSVIISGEGKGKKYQDKLRNIQVNWERIFRWSFVISISEENDSCQTRIPWLEVVRCAAKRHLNQAHNMFNDTMHLNPTPPSWQLGWVELSRVASRR